MDSSSIMLLLIGKDSNILPYIMLIMFIYQQWATIKATIYKATLFGKAQYQITGKVYTNLEDPYTYGTLPTAMWALLHTIDNIIKKNNIKVTKATNIDLPDNHTFDDKETIMMPSSADDITLTPYIKCKIETNSERQTQTNREHKNSVTSIDEKTITITLTSNKTIDVIMNYMKEITDNHNKIVKSKRQDVSFIIKPEFTKTREYGNSDLDYPTYNKLTSTKSFDNLFFDGKDELIKRLDTFVNRDKYKTLGLPETLGILFHGEPGTGKTSAIKAIANYLKMSVIIVPMNSIKTRKRLEDLFFSKRIDIPQEKRIYVFEEIDCNGWENIVRDRKYIKETHESNNETTALEKLADKLQNNDGMKNNKNKDDDEKLTLGAILEIIDGIIECPGRIIIMTTNHKEFLDPALLRPGRIDIEIEFKKLRRTHIAQIYKSWYGKNMDLNRNLEIPDYKFTQAEISQLLFKNEDRPDKFIKDLMKANS
jgi:ATP-dependent 26S proteasome regulatory subunit